MGDDREPRGDALGRFAVDRVVKDDGRYLLYYSWPVTPRTDGGATPADATTTDGSETPRDDV